MSRKQMAKQWLWSIGVAKKKAQFVALVGPAKQFEVYRNQFFGDFDDLTMLQPLHSLEIRRFSCRQQRRQTYTLPLMHAHRIKNGHIIL